MGQRGELRRFYVKQIEIAPPNPFADMSDEELDEFIRTEAADILPQLQERIKLKSVHRGAHLSFVTRQS